MVSDGVNRVSVYYLVTARALLEEAAAISNLEVGRAGFFSGSQDAQTASLGPHEEKPDSAVGKISWRAICSRSADGCFRAISAVTEVRPLTILARFSRSMAVRKTLGREDGQPRIRPDRGVMAHERQALDLRLRYEEAVEWVVVQRRKSRRGFGVFERNGKRLQSQTQGGHGGRFWSTKTAEGLLDHDFPDRGGAQINIVLGVTDRLALSCVYPFVVRQPPQEDVCVEQKPHRSAPRKAASRPSGSGASNTTAMTTRPFQAPGLRGFADRPIGTRRALGRPALAITISSPPAACSTSRDRLVLSS